MSDAFASITKAADFKPLSAASSLHLDSTSREDRFILPSFTEMTVNRVLMNQFLFGLNDIFFRIEQLGNLASNFVRFSFILFAGFPFRFFFKSQYFGFYFIG